MAGQAGEAPRVRRKRASKASLRFFAWTASGLSFAGALVSFALSPKPAQGAVPQKASKPARPVVIVVTKKIVYAAAARPVAPSSTGAVNYVSAPAAPPVAVSCGSTPC